MALSFEYVPLLQTQRELCEIPRGTDRFRKYIETLRGDAVDDMAVPLSAFNPMGKQHVADLLDEYLKLDADAIAAAALEQVASQLPGSAEPGNHWKIALVLADDAQGGWTNRYATEFDHRFGGKANYRRGWATGMLWTSEPPSVDSVRIEAGSALTRAEYVATHGLASDLGQMLKQSSFVTATAGSPWPSFADEEAKYTRQVVMPWLESDAKAVQVACLFGDAAARELGYEPFGLSDRAGLRLHLGS